jgi:two-component system chemotaxis response regulator CheB
LLAERLNAKSKISVVEGAGEEELQPGKAWIAPGNFHMVLEKTRSGSRIKLQQEPPENSCRPAVDVLFRSVAEIYGAASLGVILTGMGHDGLRGCEMINDGGGQILAQDRATSVVWGMPGFVAEAGLADKILPLGQVAEEIVRRISVGRERLIT